MKSKDYSLKIKLCHQAAINRYDTTLAVQWLSPSITCQSHPLPSSQVGGQCELQSNLTGGEAGWEIYSPCHRLPRLWIGICIALSAARAMVHGKDPGWSETAHVWDQRLLSRLAEPPHAGSPSLEHTFLWAQGVLGQLWVPGGVRPWWSQPLPHPSSLSAGAGSPAVPGCKAGGPGPCGERQAGGIAEISHAANKTNSSTPWGLQSVELQLLEPQSPCGCWEGGCWEGGCSLSRGAWAGRGAKPTICSHGAVALTHWDAERM